MRSSPKKRFGKRGSFIHSSSRRSQPAAHTGDAYVFQSADDAEDSLPCGECSVEVSLTRPPGHRRRSAPTRLLSTLKKPHGKSVSDKSVILARVPHEYDRGKTERKDGGKEESPIDRTLSLEESSSSSSVEEASSDSDYYDSDGDDSCDEEESEDEEDDDDEEGNESDELFAADLRGTILHYKYRIVDELGRGTFGRVMSCYEINHDLMIEKIGLGHLQGPDYDEDVYAVKIIRNDDEHYIKDAEIEARLLRSINKTGGRGLDLFPILHAEFYDVETGWKCLVLEKLGRSLLDAIRTKKERDGKGRFGARYVKEIALQLFDAIDYLHERGILHTDLKPENLLLVENHSSATEDADDDDEGAVKIKIVDFGSAVFSKDMKGVDRTSIINTRQYRAPEILLRLGWNFPSDIWAAGCVLAELALGHQLFPAKNTCEHLAMIETRLACKFPRRMLLKGGHQTRHIAKKCFNRVSARHARHKMDGVLNANTVRYIEDRCRPLQQVLGDEGVGSGLGHLLRNVLTIDPKLRPKAKKALVLAEHIHVP